MQIEGFHEVLRSSWTVVAVLTFLAIFGVVTIVGHLAAILSSSRLR